MNAEHLEILVEEPSMETFLSKVLPQILPGRVTYAIHPHQGKPDLLKKLESRLRGYAKWLPDRARIVVLLDRDDMDCRDLKRRLDQHAQAAGLITKSAACGASWQIVNRIAIEELEAWYFSDWAGVRQAYPKLRINIPNQAAYRHPDSIQGGTWEALERILNSAGYFKNGVRKVELAVRIGETFGCHRASSPSFIAFKNAVLEAVS